MGGSSGVNRAISHENTWYLPKKGVVSSRQAEPTPVSNKSLRTASHFLLYIYYILIYIYIYVCIYKYI